MVKRTLYFDLLTIAACFAVVLLHCNTQVHAFLPTPSWDGALVVEVLFYWAVPIFFMLTGANNMRYREKYDTKTFLARRMKKLIIPFVFWSLFIYLLQHVAFSNPADPSIDGFLTGIFGNSIEQIYWFFFAIISLTLAMPVLSLLVGYRKTLWYMVGLAFCFISVGPYLFALIGLPWPGELVFPVAMGYALYPLLGYLLATGEIPKKYRIALYVAAIACFALRYGFTYFSSYELGVTDETLFSYTAFTAVIPAAAVFVWFRQHDWEKPFFTKHVKAIVTISGCSFGIYLIHKIILDYIVLGVLDIGFERILMRIVCPFVLYLVTLGIVYLIKKIPVVKNIVP